MRRWGGRYFGKTPTQLDWSGASAAHMPFCGISASGTGGVVLGWFFFDLFESSCCFALSEPSTTNEECFTAQSILFFASQWLVMSGGSVSGIVKKEAISDIQFEENLKKSW